MDDERVRKKREYIRTFMQEYRGKQRKAKQLLMHQIDALEQRIVKLRTRTPLTRQSSMLSWRDVTAAVHDLRQETTLENRALKHKLQEYERIVNELKMWVAASTLLTTSPNPRQATWRDCTLLAHPQSRWLGKQWITQQMFHNTDHVFAQYGMPAPMSSEIYTDAFNKSMEIHFTEQGHLYVQRMQKKWDVPLEVVVAMFRRHTGSMFTMDAFCPVGSQVVVEEMEHTTLHQYSPSISGGFAVNLLCGEFHEADRTILVIQHIQTDEGARETGRQRSRMAWIELRRESPTVTRERFLCVISHEMTATGEPVDLVEAGRQWGVDLSTVDEEQREAHFIQAYRAKNANLVGIRRQWYSELLQAGIKTANGEL